MSAPGVDMLEFDAEIANQLMAIIGSEQVDDDYITEKLAELFGGNRHLDGDNTVNASASIQGQVVELDAPTIDKVFEGDCAGHCQSQGKIRYHNPLAGYYAMQVISVRGKTVIAFRIMANLNGKTLDALYIGKANAAESVFSAGEGIWNVARRKPV